MLKTIQGDGILSYAAMVLPAGESVQEVTVLASHVYLGHARDPARPVVLVAANALYMVAMLAKAVPIPAILEDSCCIDDGSEPAVPDMPSAEQCSCRMDSTPAPVPDPVLPPMRSDATGDGSPVDWVRTHAAVSSNSLSGPPGMHLPPGVGDGTAGRVSSRGAGESALACAATLFWRWVRNSFNMLNN